MTSQMVVVLATLGDTGENGPQFYIDGAGHLHPVPPLDPEVQKAFQAAVDVALSAEKVRDPELKTRTASLAQQLLAAPLKELHRNLDARAVIQDVLKDSRLQQALRETGDGKQTVSLIVAAAERKGHALTEQTVSQLLASLTCTQAEALTQEELLWVSGGVGTWRSPHTGRCTCPHCYTK